MYKIRSFSKLVRQKVGYELEMVQHGLNPSDWKPMTSVGTGVREIQLHVDGQQRVLYVTKLKKAIYVLHTFHKTSGKTSKTDIAIGKYRLKEALQMEDQKQ